MFVFVTIVPREVLAVEEFVINVDKFETVLLVLVISVLRLDNIVLRFDNIVFWLVIIVVNCEDACKLIGPVKLIAPVIKFCDPVNVNVPDWVVDIIYNL